MSRDTSDVTSHLPKQKSSDGVGPLYHRMYSVVVEAKWADALKAMRRFQTDINSFSPQLMCKFEKTCGDASVLKRGDEFQIHITGPWNGPVRVKDASASAFTLSTLEGHMEAGEIQFRVCDQGDGRVKFEIESLARSRDKLVDFVYDKVPIAKAAQTEMWKSVCTAVAKEITGSSAEVEVLTEKKDEDSGEWEKV